MRLGVISCIFFVVLFVVVESGMCPMESHQVCNPTNKHTCVCAITHQEASAPEKSCNRVAEPDEEGNFPAVSITFKLKEDTDDKKIIKKKIEKVDDDDDDDEDNDGIPDDEEEEEDTEDPWPQKELIDALASTLRINKETIVILRANCLGTEDELTIQFAVLKKNINSTMPYDKDDFVDAENLATRLKVMLQSMGNVNKLAGLHVEKIDYVEELVQIEFDPDNTALIIETALAAAAFIFMLLLGCCTLCRNNDEYEDDLQKA